MAELKFKDVTDGIISAFYHVNNTLGYGFLEKVYENALCYELRQRGFTVTTQTPITVWYKGVPVGEYFADLIVNQCIIVELKCGVALNQAHEAQLINYLKATGMEVGLLLFFGPKPQIRRKVFTHPTDIEGPFSYQRKSA
ncbi:conserved protein of unknown function [Candidatus Promineifilum breve]|uniref:GxxExxY protein n=1 Tax=Candidatus Promineifilum breve TaxID=1806508 RepID=A0A170PGW7_9CHLR|nr:GxxExxY protein [Candidatus Promineifilum breve]CUS03987.2 conserved protein of unknown function [Candidatus Promineifilum breve]